MLATRLAIGLPADSVPDRLALVFTLCSNAHRLAARLALDAATGHDRTPTVNEQKQLHEDTLREHAIRIALDWPRLIEASPELSTQCRDWLVQIPHRNAGTNKSALSNWLATGLGESPETWLSRFSNGGDWQSRQSSPAPILQLLEQMQALLTGVQVEWQPLVLSAPSHGDLQDIAIAMATLKDFCMRPHLRGRVPDTGPWSRPWFLEQNTSEDAFARLLARIADLARLSCIDDCPLRSGGFALGIGEGVGWCEMARGLLIHYVKLEIFGNKLATTNPHATVANYQVLAPTEWNFHPDGHFANTLSQLTRTAPNAQVGALIAAFDPCIHTEIVH